MQEKRAGEEEEVGDEDEKGKKRGGKVEKSAYRKLRSLLINV